MTLHDLVLIAVMVLVAALVQLWTATKVSSADEARIARLERRVDALLIQLRRGPDGDAFAMQSAPMDEVRSLVRQGRKIEAIKVYRELTGEGLKDSKDAVDALEITERVK